VEGKSMSKNGLAFQEFIQKTVDEAIESDEQYAYLENEILKLEKELLPLLDPDAKDKYIKIDEFITEQAEVACKIIYRQFYDNYDKFTIILGDGITRK
jgi:hypothetical protein